MTNIRRKGNELCTLQSKDDRKGKWKDVQIYTEELEAYEQHETDE
jgi:hypothetical protein